MSRNSNREEVLSGNLATTGNSLLRMAGGWGTFGGPGMFMIRTITSGTITAIFTGMTGAICAAMIYGTAGLPFVVCSCIGFCVGAIEFYRDSVRKSLMYLDRYPRLIQVHLDANFPALRFDLWDRERLSSGTFRRAGWALKSMLVVGWLSAMPAIENIIDIQEQSAVDEGGQLQDKLEEVAKIDAVS